jgi:hypothetical protein
MFRNFLFLLTAGGNTGLFKEFRSFPAVRGDTEGEQRSDGGLMLQAQVFQVMMRVESVRGKGLRLSGISVI